MSKTTGLKKKAVRSAVGAGVILLAGIVPMVFREEIGLYLRPELSLSLEAGPRSYSEDRSENIRWLLERGVSPNLRIPERRNYAAIHAAAHWGIESSLRLFVEAGADLNQTVVLREETLAPLDLACKFGGPAAVSVLASNGGKRLLSHTEDSEGRPNFSECFD